MKMPINDVGKHERPVTKHDIELVASCTICNTKLEKDLNSLYLLNQTQFYSKTTNPNADGVVLMYEVLTEQTCHCMTHFSAHEAA